VRMIVWFVLRDSPGNPWQSGLLDQRGVLKPAFHTFRGAARALDAGNPILPAGSDSALVPALELAYRVPVGAPVRVTLSPGLSTSVPLRRDGWLEVPLAEGDAGAVELRAEDAHGNAVSHTITLR
jgi:hypothetical protein